MMEDSEKKAVLVIGAGDATGGAIARRFAREGFTASVTRRSLYKFQPLLEQINKPSADTEAAAELHNGAGVGELPKPQ